MTYKYNIISTAARGPGIIQGRNRKADAEVLIIFFNFYQAPFLVLEGGR